MNLPQSVYDSRPWIQHYGSMPAELKTPEYNNVVEMIVRSAEQFAARKAFTAVTANGMNGTLSYAKADEHSDAFAVYLREHLGLKEGARVAIQMPNCLTFPVAAFGILKAGCVLVNVNPLYTAVEMEKQFIDSGVEALVIVDMFADKLTDILPRTQVKHVILTSVSEMFPPVVKQVIKLVQRYWNRMIPKCEVQTTPFRETLHKGYELKQNRQIAVKTYWEHLTRDSVAVLQYTGGTTGIAKGAMLTHGNLLTNVDQIHATGVAHNDERQEVMLTALPLYHIFAFSVNLLAFHHMGGNNILIPSPRPISNLRRAIENYPVTWMTGVNTLFNALLNEDWFKVYPPKHLHAAIAGGAALHQAVAKRWAEVTGTRLVEGYGLTETSPVITFNPLEGKVRPGSIGVPVPGTDVRIVDDQGRPVPVGESGELIVQGPQVMLGYWNRDEETAKAVKDGWFYTGDMARMDEDGFFYIVDRKKDMILVSGFNVYPNEVEDCIAKIDAVQEVAVIGVPDQGTGEAVRAYVVKRDEVTAEEVRQHCLKALARYKVPKQVEFRDELPKTPIGKVLRKDLRQEYLQQHAQ
ncbi:long-chain-fatty-acid--CoA ligase [Alkalilimnicola ehrlichii]|uniref:Long-chain-fatty-acid--CoA ligase n=1 Tax=Alkalilimnicola ehrlichii TaxID=351052 RepID=A0A3E0WK73_9GAMM|nr:AMP-binding protein [Alkalilimnicola ehrlichii]RFA25363.1 long-chain-fatty-acid--CoA ligase [Alkalilimnicola ehrlichii]RFA32541.1 long-chain-fatty-acid--CoA ligase [Alkalilimnicola ehrlichii]